MKKFLGIIVLSILLNSTSFADVAGGYKKGKGVLKISKNTANVLEYYFSKGKNGAYAKEQKVNWIGELFVISVDGNYYSWFNTPVRYQSNVAPGHYTGKAISNCKKKSGQDCYIFASRNKIVWDNGSDKKKRRLKRKDIKAGKTIALLTELGFYDGSTSSSTITPKVIEKKEPKIKKKIVKKYSESGERSIALSWDGYEDLIAGTVKFDEADYKGTLSIPLPNNDGTCDGTYSLQEGGKGTWQIACSNNMGAAGTLKWTKNGGVTGSGRDHNDKKVKFTVSKKS